MPATLTRDVRTFIMSLKNRRELGQTEVIISDMPETWVSSIDTTPAHGPESIAMVGAKRASP